MGVVIPSIIPVDCIQSGYNLVVLSDDNRWGHIVLDPLRFMSGR